MINDSRPPAGIVRRAAAPALSAAAVLALLLAPPSGTLRAQLDESWTVTVNGQTVPVNPDGSFRIPNISAADNFGPGGPGTRPDFLSDDFIQVLGMSTAGDRPRFASSEPFQIRQGETFRVRDLTVSEVPPPLPQAIRIEAESRRLEAGGSARIAVLATLGDGSTLDVSPRAFHTIYRTSNPAIATVEEARESDETRVAVHAHLPGTAFITATNGGATAVARFDIFREAEPAVIEGFVQLEDGTAAEGARIVNALFGIDAVSGPGGFFSIAAELPPGARITLEVTLVVPGGPPLRGTLVVTVSAEGLVDAGIVRLSRSVPPSRRLFDFPFALSDDQSPAAIALGDLDGDGDLDAVVTDDSNGVASVLLNDGHGQFPLDSPGIPVGSCPLSLALGDLDGDSDLDIAIADVDTDSVVMLFNDGRGAFPAGDQVVKATGDAPFAVVLGDLDGDRDLDMATADNGAGTVSVHLNDGRGGFPEGLAVLVGVGPISAAIGDLDGDRDLDLATADFRSNAVSLLFNDGEGRFPGGSASIPAGSAPAWVAMGDADGDGDLDIAVANRAFPGAVTLLLNDGGGGFPEETAASIPVGLQPRFLEPGDIDGDGDLDLLIAPFFIFTGAFSILFNDGPATPPRVIPVPLEDRGPYALAAGDLDSDGDPDLAVVSRRAGTVDTLFNRGGGEFPLEIPSVPVLNFPAALDSGDVDGDSDLDIVAANRFTTSLSLLLNDGSGGFPEGSPPITVAADPIEVSLGDLDGDRDLDIAVASADSRNISILLNDGQGGFPAGLSTSILVDRTPSSMALGDLDSDGDLDIAVSSFSEVVMILSNDGQGGFARTVAPLETRGEPASIALGDIDGDGDLDIALANEDSGSVSLFFNEGPGLFSPESRDFPVAAEPLALALADLDGNGTLDGIAASGDEEAFSVLINDGQGQFILPALEVFLPSTPRALELGDLDGDRNPDAVVIYDSPGAVTVHFGDGQGGFPDALGFRAVPEPLSLEISDLDGDGDPDLAIGDSSAPASVAILRSRRVP